MTHSNAEKTHVQRDKVEQSTPQHSSEVVEKESQPSGHAKRNWLPVAAALAFGAAVLGWEYRDVIYPLLSSPLLFLLACVGIHFFMHRGHGKH
ncbi:DUF2933 domain-containing protein [Ruegeria sp. Alg231-54]|uniref:DUF2933 domain-containing protein n=1 Tax=Ruegeria sp. Alg231-54 TaxID=1922221 RepID=UPI000D55F2CA|nr:DUF2933 domain-containing protein [Ruegeria sp. Alg231-54]